MSAPERGGFVRMQIDVCSSSCPSLAGYTDHPELSGAGAAASFLSASWVSGFFSQPHSTEAQRAHQRVLGKSEHRRC